MQSIIIQMLLNNTRKNHSGQPPPPFSKGGGLRFKPKFQKGGGGVENFQGGLSLKEVGVKILGGCWIPGHNFPSISNFIFSFSQQMTFLNFFSVF